MAPAPIFTGEFMDIYWTMLPCGTLDVYSGDTFVITITANASGIYLTTAVPAGNYLVYYKYPGYETIERNVTLVNSVTTTVNPAMKKASQNYDEFIINYIFTHLKDKSTYPQFSDIIGWYDTPRQEISKFPVLMMLPQKDTIEDGGIGFQWHNKTYKIFVLVESYQKEFGRRWLSTFDENLKQFFDEHPHFAYYQQVFYPGTTNDHLRHPLFRIWVKSTELKFGSWEHPDGRILDLLEVEVLAKWKETLPILEKSSSSIAVGPADELLAEPT